MLLEEIRNIKSEKKDLRNFGLIMGVFFGLLGGLLWWKGKDTYSLFLILSVVFSFFGLALPNLLRPFQKAWMALAVVLGFLMTRVILSVIFYLVFASIGLILRLLGRQLLLLTKDSSKQSYWVRREQKSFDRQNYERQF